MDPLQDRFCRVLMELVAARESYLVVETAAGTGNRLLRFCSKAERSRSLFDAERLPALARCAAPQRTLARLVSIQIIERSTVAKF